MKKNPKYAREPKRGRLIPAAGVIQGTYLFYGRIDGHWVYEVKSVIDGDDPPEWSEYMYPVPPPKGVRRISWLGFETEDGTLK
jgi:hypothetical protein